MLQRLRWALAVWASLVVHLQVAFLQNLSFENTFYLHIHFEFMQSRHFGMKAFAGGLVLKQNAAKAKKEMTYLLD